MTVVTEDLKLKIAGLLSTLIDMDVDVYESSEANSEKLLHAFYGREETESACVLDLALANSLGAALPRIHPSMASDATKDNKCPENIRENVDEILNVCTSLLRLDQKQRVQLIKTVGPGEEFPEAWEGVKSGETLAFRVEFGNYETGIMTLCLPK